MNVTTTSTVNDERALQQELERVRQLSLQAARENDFRMVARLTAEASRLNRALREEGDDAILARLF